jgi:hypothetical protein
MVLPFIRKDENHDREQAARGSVIDPRNEAALRTKKTRATIGFAC